MTNVTQATRLFDLLNIQAKETPYNNFLSYKENNSWKSYTFEAVQKMVDRTSQLLLDIGLKKEDTIAIISVNRPEWNFVDIGAQQIGVTVIPIYPTISEKDYEYIFKDAAIQYVFIGDTAIYQKVKHLQDKITSLKNIYTFDNIPDVHAFLDALPVIIDAEKIQTTKNNITEDDVATIIYTSGTTGNPKGVMLTHKNIVSNVKSIQTITPFGEGEKALSFLPLCHSFERMVFYAYLSLGMHIHYAESLNKIGENLLEVKPFCFTTVPRMLEKVYDKIIAKGKDLNGFKRKLFFWAIDIGAAYRLGKDNSWWYRQKLALARKLIFSKWKEALGGNVHFIITGAAAMQPRLITLFTAAGILVLEGYGLTETSPVLSCNRVDENERCIGTIGIPIPHVAIQLAEDGEILAKGPNIMKGYYKRPDLTAEVIDKDGWFHTGDIGIWIERDGIRFLKITDRKKELFKTAGGKYIAPQVIENKMKESPFIEQIMIVGGDDKNFISALIVPSFQYLEKQVKQHDKTLMNKEMLIRNEKTHALIQHEIKKYNENFGSWEQLKKFVLLPNEWTEESGELTPTLKLKRKIIHEHYSREIEQIYGESQDFHDS